MLGRTALWGIRVGPGAVLRMQNNIFAFPWVVDIEVDESKKPPGW